MIQWLILRPTFEIPISVEREEAIERIATECKQVGQPRLFFVHGEYGELHLPTDQHRLWSPHLSFYVSQENVQTIIRGRFAPRLEIWTFIWILYLAMAFIALFAMVMEFSKWSIGEESWWRWVAVLALVAIATIYVVANVGQQWSSDQMKLLRERLDQILSDTKLTA
jgi:hypothetical protein